MNKVLIADEFGLQSVKHCSTHCMKAFWTTFFFHHGNFHAAGKTCDSRTCAVFSSVGVSFLSISEADEFTDQLMIVFSKLKFVEDVIQRLVII